MNRSNLAKQMDREVIDELKNDSQALSSFFQHQTDGAILCFLEKLGRLENNNSKDALINLLNNRNENIRVLAIKNLAKLTDLSLLAIFSFHGKNDASTEVKRESVSAIGRLRNESAISTLITFLQDKDPKVIMQAIRGLLVFNHRDDVTKALNNLKNHPNELIKEAFEKKTKNDKPSHNKKYTYMGDLSFLYNTVIHGDVEKVLKHIPDDSIHLTFTSPPYYNARDYSIYPSYKEYLQFLERIFKEVHRVTQEGRFFVLNTSPIIISRISRAHSSKRYPIPYDIHPLLMKMGWEFIDDIVWIKPEASVKNRNAGFFQHRKPLGYKPNAVSEMIMVYRKKTDKLIDWNMKQYDDKTTISSKVLEKYETTNVWKIDPTFDKVHSAVFPVELCNRIIKFYSYEGDLVFDPFGGSGTFGHAALKLKRSFLLTEKEQKYINRIKESLRKHDSLFKSAGKEINFLGFDEFIKLSKNK